MPLLIPGIGTQGGDLEKAVIYGVDANGEKAIINSSRQIIFASRGSDFASAASKAATALRDRINYYRKKP
jgi:orotidine-5'-phosphate decarboxylase